MDAAYWRGYSDRGAGRPGRDDDRVVNWMARWWRGAQRRTDMSTLWPACKRHAASLDDAKMAFYLHASNDPAWTEDYNEEDLIYFIGRLQ